MYAKKTLSLVLVIFFALACTCSSLTPVIKSSSPTLPAVASSIPTPTQITVATATPTPKIASPLYIPPGCENVPLATTAPQAAITPTSLYPTNQPVDSQKQIRIFDSVIQKIESVYVYENYNGKDWTAIKEKYRTQIKGGLSTEKFYEAMEALVKELGDDHSRFLTPQDVLEEDSQYVGKDSYVGIGVVTQLLESKKKLVVWQTLPDASAEKSGIKPHDSILAVDGIPVVEEGKPYSSRLRGAQCSAVNVTVQSPNGQIRNITLIRYKVNSIHKVEARLLPTTDGSKIGYLSLPTFLEESLPTQVEQALREWGKLDGLILDDRLNEGGAGEVVDRILAYFTSGTLGEFKSREGTRRFRVRPDPIHNSQTVPLVILIGKDSASFGEIFPGVLQDTGRAKLVGERTSGNVETLYGYDFEDGSRIWIAQETFIPANAKKTWEGVGVTPDVMVAADWDTFSFENDPAIEAALKVLGRK